MSKLYHELAFDYHEMYQNIFDYEKEYEIHKKIFNDFNCRNILEVGCGTGNLSRYFLRDGFVYTGTDISEEMLAVAMSNNPETTFLKFDMRELWFPQLFDAIFISGRSFTYMTSNDDVLKALKSIDSVLKEDGILVFDNFNAEEIFGNFREYMESESKTDLKVYKRKNINRMDLRTGWTWEWDATYTIEEPGKEKRIVNDKSILRAFTCEELKLFLQLAGFSEINSEKNEFWIRTIAKKRNKNVRAKQRSGA